MSFIGYLLLAVLAAIFGAAIHNAITASDRELGRAAKAKAEREEAERAEAGRKANERANFKMDVAGVLDDLVSNPDWLRGRQGNEGYRKPFTALHHFLTERQRIRAIEARLTDAETHCKSLNGNVRGLSEAVARLNDTFTRDIEELKVGVEAEENNL